MYIYILALRIYPHDNSFIAPKKDKIIHLLKKKRRRKKCHASPVDWCAIRLSSLKTSSHHIIFAFESHVQKGTYQTRTADLPHHIT